MVNLLAIQTALAAQIGARARPALRSLAEPEDQINPPVGIVMPGGSPFVVYGQTLEGATGWLGDASLGNALSPRAFNLDYWILLSKASTLDRVEGSLASWLGFESSASVVSVAAAVEADPTLSGTVEWCVPLTADRPGPVEWNTVQYFGTRIHFSLSAR